jgi:hypothetical protein
LPRFTSWQHLISWIIIISTTAPSGTAEASPLIRHRRRLLLAYCRHFMLIHNARPRIILTSCS